MDCEARIAALENLVNTLAAGVIDTQVYVMELEEQIKSLKANTDRTHSQLLRFIRRKYDR